MAARTVMKGLTKEEEEIVNKALPRCACWADEADMDRQESTLVEKDDGWMTVPKRAPKMLAKRDWKVRAVC
jgi:hypothetical protein